MTGSTIEDGNGTKNAEMNETAENEMSTFIDFSISAEPVPPGPVDERRPRMRRAADIAVKGARAAMTVGIFASLMRGKGSG